MCVKDGAISLRAVAVFVAHDALTVLRTVCSQTIANRLALKAGNLGGLGGTAQHHHVRALIRQAETTTLNSLLSMMKHYPRAIGDSGH